MIFKKAFKAIFLLIILCSLTFGLNDFEEQLRQSKGQTVITVEAFKGLSNVQIKNYLVNDFSLDYFEKKPGKELIIAVYKFSEVRLYGDNNIIIRRKEIKTSFPEKHFTDCLQQFNLSKCYNNIINKESGGYNYNGVNYYSTWMQARVEAIRGYLETLNLQQILINNEDIIGLITSEIPNNNPPI